MYNKLISVIITNYKHHQYLMQCVQSILNQTHKNFEIIIVNDDPGVDLRQYQRLDHRIIIIQNKINKGQPAANNRGIRFANGEYIAFQDADDWSIRNRLKLQKEILDSGYDACYGDCITIKIDGCHYTHAPGGGIDTLRKRSIGVWGSTMVRRSICPLFKDVGYGNDRIWWINLFSKTDKIYHLNLPIYYYRWNTSNYRKFHNIPVIRKLYRLWRVRRLQGYAEAEFEAIEKARNMENANKQDTC